jgi:Phage integrase family
MASFHGSVSASTNEGKKASHSCRTRLRVTGGTCRSVNGVYNTSLGFLAYLPNKPEAFIWLGAKLNIERGIVKQIVDDVKTDSSRKFLAVDKELLEVLRLWKQTTQFSAEEDWIFASPVKLGRLPYSYTGFWRELERASKEAGIGHLGTHAFRHTYRSWLDAVGTPIAVQQKLMRRRGDGRNGAGAIESCRAGTKPTGLTDCASDCRRA